MYVDLVPFITRVLHVLVDVFNVLWAEAPYCLGLLPVCGMMRLREE